MPVYKINIQELKPEFLQELKEKYENAEVEIRIFLARGNAPEFTEADFWHVISLLDWSQEEDDDEAILEPAIAYLSTLDEASIYRFQDILSEKLFELDKRVYAENLGPNAPKKNGAFSSDYFLYARACVVANGKAYFEAVLADPAQMPKEYTFEPLLYLAEEAYERKTGKPFDYFPTVSYETFSNPEGWDETLLDKLTE